MGKPVEMHLQIIGGLLMKKLLIVPFVLALAGCVTTNAPSQPSSTDTRNVEAARKLYADFLRGDIDSVLAAMSDDITWVMPGPSALPYAGTRHGKAEWMNYLQGLGATEVLAFEPKEFIAEGDKVVVLGTERLRVKATGKVIDEAWAQVLTFNDGKLTRFQSYDDTAAAVAGFSAAP